MEFSVLSATHNVTSERSNSAISKCIFENPFTGRDRDTQKVYRDRDIERETETERQRQTDRETETDRQRDRDTEREGERETDRDRHTKTNRQK